MLRLVGKCETLATPTLRHMAICDVEDDLAAYVEHWLRSCWPDVVVRRSARFQDLDTRLLQLLVCGTEPASAVQIPTLWLGDVDRKANAFRLSRRLWTSATPITGRRLLSMVKSILATAC